jgi:hypothetical protein
MSVVPNSRTDLPVRTRTFYRRVLTELTKAKIPFLVGGAYALECYTDVWRDTKDLDVFIRPDDVQRVLRHFHKAGFKVELTFPHWLAKVFGGKNFVDVIFSSGNGIATVDEDWFRYAKSGKILGAQRNICPAEEMIWSKAFVMERERFDGADVAHLLLSQANSLDWERLLRRLGPHWEILLTHLILFGFVYPGSKSNIPDWLIQKLTRRLLAERKKSSLGNHAVQGTLLSRAQYLIDLRSWGYRDARLQPKGRMSAKDIAIWTDAIEAENRTIRNQRMHAE